MLQQYDFVTNEFRNELLQFIYTIEKMKSNIAYMKYTI